jgi:hypothetical protein
MRKGLMATWALAFLALSRSLSAHHSVGLFEITTPIRVKGVVVHVEFANPHSVIYLEQASEDGQVVRWAVENSAPLAMLERRGITKDTVKEGDVIEACGYAPKKRLTPRNEASESDNPKRRSHWLDYPDRIITGRLLLLPKGPEVHWSHYGPLEMCISAEELEAFSR